ncbi:hypothetical protein QTN47_20870 [Danxiaibacter flavus]|uniref:Uncharacterized protein n=1 Tax=Danxiaibacter flavus TaxID=3049108 RepID=A0ABV3ZNB9_9BACT|nr:hypothetical protein QNM32_20875 [Chitinophagaceae bacterium DXS]
MTELSGRMSAKAWIGGNDEARAALNRYNNIFVAVENKETFFANSKKSFRALPASANAKLWG